MPPSVETPTLEAAPEPIAPALDSALPESVRAVVPKQDYAATVDQFFKEPAKAPAPPPAAPKAEAPKPPAEPAVKPKTQSVADKLAERAAAPKVKAEDPPAAPKAEAPKADAPPPEKSPEDEVEIDARAANSTKESFLKLKTITKGVRDQLIAKDREAHDLREKLAAAAIAPTTQQLAELERLKAEHKALSDRMLVIDTENHPAFKQQYVEPRNQAIAAAKELLEANEIKDADLAKLINLPRGELGRAVGELTKNLPDLDRAEVAQNVLQAWKLNEAGRAALKSASSTYQGIRQKTEAEQHQLFASRWTTTAGAGPVKLEIAADATPEQRAEFEAFNTDVEAIRTRAEQIALAPLSEEQVADHAIKSSAYDFHLKHVQPQLLKAITERNETIAELTRQLENYRSRNPNRDIAPTPAGSAEPAKGAGAGSIEELANSMYPGR